MLIPASAQKANLHVPALKYCWWLLCRVQSSGAVVTLSASSRRRLNSTKLDWTNGNCITANVFSWRRWVNVSSDGVIGKQKAKVSSLPFYVTCIWLVFNELWRRITCIFYRIVSHNDCLHLYLIYWRSQYFLLGMCYPTSSTIKPKIEFSFMMQLLKFLNTSHFAANCCRRVQ